VSRPIFDAPAFAGRRLQRQRQRGAGAQSLTTRVSRANTATFACSGGTAHQLDGKRDGLAGERIASRQRPHLDSGQIAKRVEQRGRDQAGQNKRDHEAER
jgi:hypothetical protein